MENFDKIKLEFLGYKKYSKQAIIIKNNLDTINNLYNEGSSVSAIAKILQISSSTLMDFFKKNKIPNKRSRILC